MSSIPLPALDVHTPPDPLAEYAKVVSLKGMMQQQQVQQQEMQVRQQQIQDQAATTKAWSQYDPKQNKPEDMPGLILKNGGSGTAAQKAQQTILASQDTASQIALRDAQTGEKNIANKKANNDAALGIIKAHEGVPDEQLVTSLGSAFDEAEKNNTLDPAHVQAGRQLLQSGNPNQIRQALPVFEKSLQGANQIFEEAKTKTQQQVEQQKADASDWKEAGQGTLVNVNRQSPEFGKLIKGVAPVDQQEMQDWLAKNAGKGPADYMAYKAKLVPQFNFNMQNAGTTGTSGQPSAIAQALASGQMKWSDAVSPRTPLSIKQALFKEVQGIKPDFNTGDFSIEQAVKKDFTSGSDAQKLQAFNTAITHMGIFKQTAEALDNGDIKSLSKLGNVLGVEFGGEKVGDFNIAKKAFVGEVSRAFDGAGVTQGDRKDVDEQISAASSPKALLGAAATAEKLLRGKRDVLKQQYEAGKQGQANFGDESTPASSSSADPFAAFGGKSR